MDQLPLKPWRGFRTRGEWGRGGRGCSRVSSVSWNGSWRWAGPSESSLGRDGRVPCRGTDAAGL